MIGDSTGVNEEVEDSQVLQGHTFMDDDMDNMDNTSEEEAMYEETAVPAAAPSSATHQALGCLLTLTWLLIANTL